MIKRLMIYSAILAIAFTAVSCARKEEEKAKASTQMQKQEGHEGIYTGPGVPGPGMIATEPGQSPHGTGLKEQRGTVVVPESVKGKWRGVILIVEDKKNNTKKDYEVKLNSEFTIPDSNIVIKTGEFLPSFTMDDKTYTSRSNNPDNPGVNLTILEDGKEIFKGWVFSKFPTMHPFTHKRFGIILKEGMQAS